MHRPRLLVLSSLLLFSAMPARAAMVAIVQPVHDSTDLNQTLVLIRGELLSVGLDVAMVERPPAGKLGAADSQAWLEDLSKRGIDAVVDAVGVSEPVAVEVWVVGKSSGRLELSRVSVEPSTPNASEKLAIRAIEVLRSRFLELDLVARSRGDRPPATPPASSRRELDGLPHPPGSVGVELGAVMLASLDGVGPAFLPTMRLGWTARPALVLQASLAGFGTRSTVAATAGSALVGQQYGVLGGRYRFRAGHSLRPLLGLATGFLHTSVEGRADTSKEAHSAQRWSLLLDGSVGAELELGRYAMTLAAHVQVAAPYVAIQFVDEQVASSGRPNLQFSLTVGVWP